VGTWHDPDLGRPIAAPLERCAQLLGVDLATVGELAANVEPYVRADGTRIWSLMQLERQLRPERMAGAAAVTSTANRPRSPMHSQSGVSVAHGIWWPRSCYAPSAQATSDLLHAIHGMPSQTLLLRVFTAGHARSRACSPPLPGAVRLIPRASEKYREHPVSM
jgi:hypothetical protein